MLKRCFDFGVALTLLSLMLPVMAVVAVFVFFLLRLAPGDPAAIIAGEDATAVQIAAVRAKLGLDRVSLDSPASPNFAQRQENNVFSYRFGAQYDLNPTTMVYATASRGFKGGQIATPSGAAPRRKPGRPSSSRATCRAGAGTPSPCPSWSG